MICIRHSGDGLMLDATHRRQALQLACQLPEKREDALKVLGYLSQLFDGFMAPVQPARPLTPRLVLVDAPPEAGGASPKRRARSSGKPSGLPK